MNKETSKITRVEIIDKHWRQYVNMNCRDVIIDLQDEDRTLKIFLTNNK